jgi:hypothetical protein
MNSEKEVIEEEVPEVVVGKVPTVNLECRMYEEKLPEQDVCVMVNVRQITEVGTYVHLIEYNNIEGINSLTRNDFVI